MAAELCNMSVDSVACRATLLSMIKTFKSKALKLFWEQGNKKGLIQEHVARIDRMLTLLGRLDKRRRHDAARLRDARTEG